MGGFLTPCTKEVSVLHQRGIGFVYTPGAIGRPDNIPLL